MNKILDIAKTMYPIETPKDSPEDDSHGKKKVDDNSSDESQDEAVKKRKIGLYHFTFFVSKKQ